jgi:uncharacterized membrane protein
MVENSSGFCYASLRFAPFPQRGWRWSPLKSNLKKIFLAGLAVIIPIGITLYILSFLIGVMDSLLNVIPSHYQPDALLHFHLPGLGIIVTVVLVLICGLVARSYFGNVLVGLGERFVDKIPVVRSIYQAVKQVAHSMLGDKSRSFKKAVLIEFPRRGLYSVGFVTGSPEGEIRKKIGGEGYISVFVPTTPNPTSGFFMIVAPAELIFLDMSVEEAFTLIISAGIVTPSERQQQTGLKPRGAVEEGRT